MLQLDKWTLGCILFEIVMFYFFRPLGENSANLFCIMNTNQWEDTIP